jgi:GNAT superfamily N-acetyltransferase
MQDGDAGDVRLSEVALDRFELPARFAIRPCTEGDLENLEWFGMFTAHREIIREAFRRHRTGENPMLVLDLGGFTVGQTWIDLAKKRARSTGVIWALRVFPFFQGMGLGTRLLDAAEGIIRGAGRAVAEIGVERTNEGARRLYERRGYSLAGEEREEYSYEQPDGVRVEAVSDTLLFHKMLGRGAREDAR